MLKTLIFTSAIALVGSPAFADDWTGAPLAPQTVPGNPGFPPYSTGHDQGSDVKLTVICSPLTGNKFTNPPCGPNTAPTYNDLVANPDGSLSNAPNSVFSESSIPAGVPSSQLAIQASGPYSDPTAPGGVSLFSGYISLSDFASSASVANSFANVQTQLDGLSADIQNTNANLQRLGVALQAEQRLANSGIAQALAMAGSTYIEPDENYSVSLNMGTFGGQTAFAGSAVVRISEHAAFNAGFTSQTRGGTMGARAGIRFGW